MFASILEKGRPLTVADGMLQIGFAKGSFELSRLQDKESFALLCELACTYFAQETTVKLVPLTDAQQDLPPSIAEKKNREAVDRRRELHEIAEGHPLVKAALEVFGGSIEDLKEL